MRIDNCHSWERFTPIILVFLLAVGVRVFHLIEFSRTCPLFNPVAPAASIIEFSSYIAKKKNLKAALFLVLLSLTVWLVRSEIRARIRPGDYFMLGMAAARDNNTDIFVKSMHLYKNTKPDDYIMRQILKYRNRFKIQADKNGRPVYVRN